jgi:crotonobetainyl-CoA:carnitine CoA-transferase CaiB-like acyl-CoA transferase
VLRSPLWFYYRCQDDKWFAIGVLQADRYWPDVCRVMGIEHLRDDPKFKNASARAENVEEIISIFKEVFLTKPRGEWWQLFKGAEIPSAPVNDMADLVNDPQVIANGWVSEVDDPSLGKVRVPGVTVQLSKTPGKVRALAPELGQHTEEVLMEVLGYTWDDIAKLREKGVY